MKTSTSPALLALLFVILATLTTTQASSGTSQAPSGTTQAPSGTTQASSGTSQAPSGTTQAPSGTTQTPPKTTQAPSGTTQAPSGTTQAPSGTTQASSGTTQAPSGTTQAPSGTTQAPSGTTQAPSGTTQAPPKTTQAPSGTTQAPSGTTQAPPKTTQAPSGTTQAPSGTTQAPPKTTQAPSGTTQAPSGTTQAPPKTTQAPSGTTQAPSGTTQAPPKTTQAPSGTTQAPSRTTQAPSGTTQAPSGTTQVPPKTTQAPSGTTQAPSGTTQASPGNSSIPSSSGPSHFCQRSPCGGDAACINLNSTGFCLCVEGYYYHSSSCLKGKTFPGYIILQGVEGTDLDNKSSLAYEKLYDNVTNFFQTALHSSDYGQTVILKVSAFSSLPGKSEMRADNKHVNASVVNILQQSTSLSEKNVTTMIKRAISSNQIGAVQYEAENRCEFYGCVETDPDNCSNGLQCECKPGLQRPNEQSPFCVPLECPKTCSAELKKQCLKKESGNFECRCLPDYQEDDNGVCHECPFGYSGMDCEDQFQLILTIVGTIAGVLILGLLISVICSARSKNKKNNIEEQKLIDNDFQNLQMRSTGFSNLGADGSLFPKVRTSASKDIHTENPYANQRSGLRPDY